MKILNFGSLNLDYVYAVDHIVQPGETLSSRRLDVFAGGKGLNQSVALARAGARVCHAGMVGADGDILVNMLRENGVDVSHVRQVEERSGNAIIQVGADGQNSIVLFGGANLANDGENIERVLAGFEAGDLVLLQNEINLIDRIVDRAHEKGLLVVLNPSPFNEAVQACDLSKISLFLVNEVEGEQITGEADPEKIPTAMRKLYPSAKLVLTLGGEGAVYQDEQGTIREPARRVDVVDTTAAGDTFAGYFLAAIMEGLNPETALRRSVYAASLAVSRPGAAPSIPYRNEVDSLMAAK